MGDQRDSNPNAPIGLALVASALVVRAAPAWAEARPICKLAIPLMNCNTNYIHKPDAGGRFEM